MELRSLRKPICALLFVANNFIIMNIDSDKLLNLKTLAGELGVGYSFTRAMRKAGLQTPGGRTTLNDARRWLRSHPEFRVSTYLHRKTPTEQPANV